MTQDELLRLIDEAAADGRPKLDLAGKGLNELPPEIGKLTRLKTLVLGRWDRKRSEGLGNHLTDLPREIGLLTELRSLYLSSNQLSTMPEIIGELTGLRALYLRNNNLSTLPKTIGQLTSLRSLYLRSNNLSTLPEIVGQLTSLRSLDLRNNNLSTLPETIGQLTSLRSLYLGSNNLSTLPEIVGQLTTLRSLSLSDNQLSTLPKVIGQLTSLRSLSLRFNQLSTLPEIIGQLTSLRSISLSDNQLSLVPEIIGQLTSLRMLNLSDNQLNMLPEIVGQLSRLRSLDLSYNELSTLPEVVGQLTSLRSLFLSFNQLNSLPEIVGRLTSLRSLSLNYNPLTSLPEVVGQLSNLRSLSLNNIHITSLPEVVGQLSNLQSLGLNSNNLTYLPKVVGQMSNLQMLYLNSNRLTRLPEVIGQLTSLQTLDLRSNQLTSLPEVVGQLTSLQTLDLRSNQLTSLPEVVSQLTSLQTLYLDNNQLTTLPTIIEQLIKLQELTLWDNKISELPSWIQKLTTLKKLDLRANRLPIPPEILGNKNQYRQPASAAEVIDYYFQEKEEVPLYEAKLIIVGEGGAGKTTLAKKLKDPNYELAKDEKSTEGIEVIPYEFDHPDGYRCKVNIWDFGGQEIYHATHQFFLTERAVYALVTDSRQGNTDFYFWLNVIQLHGADSPVILIKNEKQDRPCSVPDLQLRGEFKNLEKSIETNLASNRNLETIKATLEQYIGGLQHIGDAPPKTWAKVRSVLENQALGNNNYIDIQDYRQICCAQGIPNRTEQERLSRFLHHLGIFLHFQAIPQLAKTIFLKPAWSTDAVYKVLDTPTVRKDCGRFCHEDLNKIWSDAQYADVRGELLALMQEFEVCYEIVGRKHHYIAPHLLEANLPEEHQYNWDIQENIILSYHYPFKPKNIFPRFIVALHRYIEKQTVVWKHGVVLSIGNTRAEVIEDVRYEAANIHIRISGTDKKRLLSIVGHELEKIHASFEHLRYETRIPCNCLECKQSQEPYQFAYNVLQKSLDKRNFEVQCQKSFTMVNVRRLIDDVIEPYFNSEPSIVSPHNEPRTSKNSPFANRVDFTVNFPPQQYQENPMSNTINQYGLGDNIGGDKVLGDKIQTQINNNPDLAQSARDIKALLNELSEEYNPDTDKGKAKIKDGALAQIRQNPQLKQRAIAALKSAGEEALEQAIQHPVAKVVVEGVKGFIEG